MFEIEKKICTFTTEYFIKGTRTLHREDGPAIEWHNGREEWFFNGRLHREGGPAYIAEWYSQWYKHGELHREDGPAVTYDDGTEHWYWEGELHREDGPAVKSSHGFEKWFLYGKKHRTNGPAVINQDGTFEWYLDGDCYTREGWLDELAEEDRLEMFYSEYFMRGLRD